MSCITMQNIAAMSVQHVQYSFDGSTPHYCRLVYATNVAAEKKIAELRRKINEKGLTGISRNLCKLVIGIKQGKVFYKAGDRISVSRLIIVRKLLIINVTSKLVLLLYTNSEAYTIF